jgi:hypothetical protein
MVRDGVKCLSSPSISNRSTTLRGFPPYHSPSPIKMVGSPCICLLSHRRPSQCQKMVSKEAILGPLSIRVLCPLSVMRNDSQVQVSQCGGGSQFAPPTAASQRRRDPDSQIRYWYCTPDHIEFQKSQTGVSRRQRPELVDRSE